MKFNFLLKIPRRFLIFPDSYAERFCPAMANQSAASHSGHLKNNL
jgi:hypothetical protein